MALDALLRVTLKDTVMSIAQQGAWHTVGTQFLDALAALKMGALCCGVSGGGQGALYSIQSHQPEWSQLGSGAQVGRCF